MRFSIRFKILTGVVLLLSLMTLLGVVGIVGQRNTEHETEQLYQSSVRSLTALAQVRYNLALVRYSAALSVNETGPSLQETVDQAHAEEHTVLESLAAYEKLPLSSEARDNAAKLEEAIKTYLPAKEITLQLALRGEREASRQNMITNAKAKFSALLPLLKTAFTMADDSGKQRYQNVEHTAQSGMNLSLTLLVIAVLIGLSGGLWFAKAISSAIRSVVQAAKGIATGDLQQEFAVKSRDELGELATSFRTMLAYLQEIAHTAEATGNGDLSVAFAPKSDRDQLGQAISRMIDSLRGVVSQVRTAADSVGSSAQQIGSSSAQLAMTSSTQASGAEETSAAMEQMAANIKSVDQSAHLLNTKVEQIKNQSEQLAAAVTQTSSSIAELAASIQQGAANVSHANQASNAATDAAKNGETAVLSSIDEMNALAEAMGGIRKTIELLDNRSSEIGTIVEVIDDIAEQTNLLALNAAIEAARAGDAGRGFAVVADEVRKLAERSTKATKEIGELIKGIQQETAQAVGVTSAAADQVGRRVEGARQLGTVFQQIKDQAIQVSTLLTEVSNAAGEQARASQQIVVATEQMAGINDQVSGAVGEMSRATQGVTYATGEQRQGADQVVMAVESLSRSSQEASSATDQVARTAEVLNGQAQALQQAVGFFKLDQGRSLEIRVESAAPLSLPPRF